MFVGGPAVSVEIMLLLVCFNGEFSKTVKYYSQASCVLFPSLAVSREIMRLASVALLYQDPCRGAAGLDLVPEGSSGGKVSPKCELEARETALDAALWNVPGDTLGEFRP